MASLPTQAPMGLLFHHYWKGASFSILIYKVLKDHLWTMSVPEGRQPKHTKLCGCELKKLLEITVEHSFEKRSFTNFLDETGIIKVRV